jgi:hypothetical protein
MIAITWSQQYRRVLLTLLKTGMIKWRARAFIGEYESSGAAYV